MTISIPLIRVITTITFTLSIFIILLRPSSAADDFGTAKDSADIISISTVDDALSYIKLADSLAENREYDRAISIMMPVVSYIDTSSQVNDSLRASCRSQLGEYQFQSANYPQADSTWLQTLETQKKYFGLFSAETAKTMRRLGEVYRILNRFNDAEKKYDSALSVLTSIYGDNHPTIARVLSNKAVLLVDRGNSSDAELLLTRALTMDEQLLGKDHPDLVRLLNNLAMVYWIHGDYERAEPLYERALAIQKNAYGEDNPHLASVLNNLAILYKQQGKWDKVEPLLKQSVHIAEKLRGPDHPKVAAYLYNLAAVYYQKQEYDTAIKIYERAIAIKKKAFGTYHPDVSYGLRSLADTYCDRGDYARAESLYIQSLTIDTSTLGPEHIFAAASYEQLSRLYYLTGEIKPSLEKAFQAVQIRRRNFAENFRGLSEKNALIFSAFMRQSASQYLTIFLAGNFNEHKLLNEAGTVILETKGQVSDGIFTRQQALVREKDPVIIARAKALKEARSVLAKLFVDGSAQPDMATYRHRFDSVSVVVDSLEGSLLHLSNSYRSTRQEQNITAASVTDKLDENTLLVEYVKYQHIDFSSNTDSAYYLVLVMDHKGVKLIKDLGPASIIDSLISKLRVNYQSTASRWPDITENMVKQAIELNQRLYHSLWQAVEPLTSGKSLVLIAPDGALNLISFGTLLDNTNKYLIEKHTLHYLSAGRDIIRLQEPVAKALGMLALGDPDFNADLPDTVISETYRGSRTECNWLRNGAIPPLPYSRREIRTITKNWRKSTGQRSQTLLGSSASEENFKRFAPGKQVLHLATHGFFNLVCDDQKSSDSKSVNPLLLSGLLLSGANRHKYNPGYGNTEDGVLTAYEVTRLNLKGTRWVVLSACETGLGAITAGEGVYGLRRAFQMAGARTVINSLWAVSDKQTAKIMSQLYRSDNGNIAATLREITLKQLNKLRQKNMPDHPFSWGAFIAVGDWRYNW